MRALIPPDGNRAAPHKSGYVKEPSGEA